MQHLRLNLGCGNQTPDNWINVDYALGSQLAKIPLFSLVNSQLKIFNLTWEENIFIHDLRKIFPWSDNEIDCIYSSHTLEHLSKDQGHYFLQECHRVLKQDGIIRIVVPDLKEFVECYTRGEMLAEDFVKKLGAWQESNHQSSLKKIFQRFLSFPHQCMYDQASLMRIMSNIGFKCQIKNPFESEIDDIKIIELPDRTESAVIVEGKK